MLRDVTMLTSPFPAWGQLRYMEMFSAQTIPTLLCVLLISAKTQLCEVANVQIENEAGNRHVFELKSLDSFQAGTSVFCSSRLCQSSLGSESWTPSALRFNVVLPPGEVVTACETDDDDDLPRGLCSHSHATDMDGICTDSEVCFSSTSFEDLPIEIINRGLLPFASGNRENDYRVALAIININEGLYDKTVDDLSKLLEDYPETTAAYYVRGIAFAKKGLYKSHNALRSLADFTVCVEHQPTQHECFVWRAEVYIALNQFQEALADLNIAIALHPSKRLRFNRGIINLLLENFADAEMDFKKNLEDEKGEKSSSHILSLFHLGLSLYYRGRLRNAIEVFKEILKLEPTHIEACISLAHAFQELGNLKASFSRFDQALTLNPNNSLALQLKGSLLYHSGEVLAARPVLQQCLTVDKINVRCQYLLALCNVALGQFYEGVKGATKVMVNSLPTIRSSPEQLRAHYLREHARYQHTLLDEPLDKLKPEVGLDEDLRAQWVQGVPFKPHNTYKEQSGLQPDISDVNLNYLENWFHPSTQTLLCFAEKVGLSMQVSSDGFLPNRRLNLAMGLAAVHIAQHVQAKWRNLKTGKTGERPFTWKELFSIALQYRQLVDPDQPVMWVSSLPDYHTTEGHRADITFVRGSVTNVRVSQYFDLAFKLARSMVEHYSGEGVINYPGMATDIESAKTCEDLLAVARKRHINPHGFLVSTQVPTSVSSNSLSGEYRLDGTVLVLSQYPSGNLVFALSIASTPERTAAYSAQMDHFLLQLHQEVQRTGLGKISDMDPVLSSILSLVYYFYNLMPLTRGSSVVAYTVALGLIMSLGRQVTGKLPTSKLLDMEAMLAGAPDAFIMVVRQWLNIKKITTPVSSLPLVWEKLPHVRSVIEVLAVNTTAVCG